MDRALIDEVVEFLYHECELLDTGRYEEWLSLFAPDGVYWVPLVHNQADPSSDFSLVNEDILLLRMRIERLLHPSAHGMEIPIHTSRMLGNVRVLDADEKGAEAVARFCLVEVENDRQRVFAGRYQYALERKDGWHIKRKRVDLVNSEAPFESIQIIL